MGNAYKLLSIALLAGAVTLTGCKNKKDEVAATTPPTNEPPPAPVVTSLPPAPAPAPAPRSFEPAPTPIPAPAPAAKGSTPKAPAAAHGSAGAHAGGTYTVAKGDTLYGIARKVYNDPKMVSAILKANPGLSADKIKAGQKIHLP